MIKFKYLILIGLRLFYKNQEINIKFIIIIFSFKFILLEK